MAFIYDLDNEYGGRIISDAGTSAPALQVTSMDAGQPAIACLSTASGSVIKVTALDGAGIDADGVGGIAVDADTSSTTLPAGDFRSGATIGLALLVGKTVKGSPTIASMQFLGTSVASGAIMGFQGGFISCTSLVLTTVANTDYVIPVQVGSEMRYIPLVGAAAIVGGAAF